jgi:hypothetical protein
MQEETILLEHPFRCGCYDIGDIRVLFTPGGLYMRVKSLGEDLHSPHKY